MAAQGIFLIWAGFGSLGQMFDHVRSSLLFRSHSGWVVDGISGCAWDQSGDVGVEGESCGAVAFGPDFC